MNRLVFNLIWIIVILPLFFISGLSHSLEEIGGFALLMFLIISWFRFKDIGESPWYVFGLIVPIWNIVLLIKLVFFRSKKIQLKKGDEK